MTPSVILPPRESVLIDKGQVPPLRIPRVLVEHPEGACVEANGPSPVVRRPPGLRGRVTRRNEPTRSWNRPCQSCVLIRGVPDEFVNVQISYDYASRRSEEN